MRLYSKNYKGADYEGLDGKRNTLIHCTLWYMARCQSFSRGVTGEMFAFLFIDDGSFAINVNRQ